MSDKYKFFFDFDGTITKKELLPIIGAELGIEQEIELLTRKTIDGEIDFESSFKYRVHLLSQVPVNEVNAIIEDVPVNEKIVSWIRLHQKRCCVLTGNLDCWVKPWFDKRGINVITSESCIKNGSVSVKNTINKQQIIENEQGLKVMIGDGAGDVGALMAAQIGIGCGIVHPVFRTVITAANVIISDEDILCRTLSRLL